MPTLLLAALVVRLLYVTPTKTLAPGFTACLMLGRPLLLEVVMRAVRLLLRP